MFFQAPRTWLYAAVNATISIIFVVFFEELFDASQNSTERILRETQELGVSFYFHWEGSLNVIDQWNFSKVFTLSKFANKVKVSIIFFSSTLYLTLFYDIEQLTRVALVENKFFISEADSLQTIDQFDFLVSL